MAILPLQTLPYEKLKPKKKKGGSVTVASREKSTLVASQEVPLSDASSSSESDAGAASDDGASFADEGACFPETRGRHEPTDPSSPAPRSRSSSAEAAQKKCAVCGELAQRTWWQCECGARCHVHCLASSFLEQAGQAGDSKALLPSAGRCPSCGRSHAWPQALRSLQNSGWNQAARKASWLKSPKGSKDAKDSAAKVEEPARRGRPSKKAHSRRKKGETEGGAEEARGASPAKKETRTRQAASRPAPEPIDVFQLAASPAMGLQAAAAPKRKPRAPEGAASLSANIKASAARTPPARGLASLARPGASPGVIDLVSPASAPPGSPEVVCFRGPQLEAAQYLDSPFPEAAGGGSGRVLGACPAESPSPALAPADVVAAAGLVCPEPASVADLSTPGGGPPRKRGVGAGAWPTPGPGPLALGGPGEAAQCVLVSLLSDGE